MTTPDSIPPVGVGSTGTPARTSTRAPTGAVTPDPAHIPPTVPPKHTGRRWRRTFALAVFMVLLIAAAAFAVWSWATLRYVYASGEYRGTLQTFVRRGWVCKTWEGEVAVTQMPGSAGMQSGTFRFTVRNDSVARALQSLVGQNVVVQYDTHRGVPSSCFGETQDYVVGVQALP